ncbi:MAG: SDR family oxidoreductase [Acidimicrobiia bacterium]|nr:SDR family oxidoreductase [Acidimicrobiia bacterium]
MSATAAPVAVVVGGGGGIGSAICRRLAADGHAVVVGYATSRDRAEALANELGGTPHAAMKIDNTDSNALGSVAARIGSKVGRVDVLVNCGGVTRPVAHDDLDNLDDELIDRIFAVNWRGPFATIRAFRPLLEAAPSPVVVNISSVAAVMGIGSNVAYCASKAALDSMTRSLARSLAPTIRVMSVSPGWVLGEYAASMPEGLVDAQKAVTPLARLASGDDVAAAVSAVVHDLPMTTGAIIPVDGGRPLGI